MVLLGTKGPGLLCHLRVKVTGTFQVSLERPCPEPSDRTGNEAPEITSPCSSNGGPSAAPAVMHPGPTPRALWELPWMSFP